MAQTGKHKGLTFGIFLAPFHRVGENPTLGMARDMELVEWIDAGLRRGLDRRAPFRGLGDHRLAGGVHRRRDRAHALHQAGLGRDQPALSPSADGREPLGAARPHVARPRHAGLRPGRAAVGRLHDGHRPSSSATAWSSRSTRSWRCSKCEEPVTMKTDWFELNEARLHLAPYSYPHFPIACASTITPSGMIAAGKHGVGVLSIGAGLPGGPEAMAKQWGIYEETAAKHGHKRRPLEVAHRRQRPRRR